MNRFLDFIIPEYNTKQDLLIRALNSINRQKNLDFKNIGVIIVSDGSKNKYKKSWFKQKFPKLNIDYYPKELNEGPGLTRQYGIDRSEAQYITFLDSDDELYETDNFSKIVSTLSVDNYNILWTNFIEETEFQGKIYVKGHRPQDFHTLHGLFVNRKFLIENNIRFSNQIKFQEDTYYADILIYGYGGSYLDLFSYLWKYNESSLVRTNRKTVNWNVKIIEDYLKSGELVYEWLEKLDKDIRHRQIVMCMYGAFIILKSDQFDEERRNKNIETLLQLYEKIKDKSYNLFSKEEREEMYKLQYEATMRTLENVDFKPTFEEWISKQQI